MSKKLHGVTNGGNTKEEWEAHNMCGFQKAECSNEEGSFSITILPFIDKVQNRLAGCDAYSFLDGYSRYH
jgi:hypothetical protein